MSNLTKLEKEYLEEVEKSLRRYFDPPMEDHTLCPELHVSAFVLEDLARAVKRLDKMLSKSLKSLESWRALVKAKSNARVHIMNELNAETVRYCELESYLEELESRDERARSLIDRLVKGRDTAEYCNCQGGEVLCHFCRLNDEARDFIAEEPSCD